VRLLDQGFENARMAMPLIDCRIRSQAIQIALAFDVVNSDSLGALYDDIEGVIVVRSVFFFQFDQFLGMTCVHHWHAILLECWL
jgi:hypothetical protein